MGSWVRHRQMYFAQCQAASRCWVQRQSTKWLWQRCRGGWPHLSALMHLYSEESSGGKSLEPKSQKMLVRERKPLPPSLCTWTLSSADRGGLPLSKRYLQISRIITQPCHMYCIVWSCVKENCVKLVIKEISLLISCVKCYRYVIACSIPTILMQN